MAIVVSRNIGQSFSVGIHRIAVVVISLNRRVVLRIDGRSSMHSVGDLLECVGDVMVTSISRSRVKFRVRGNALVRFSGKESHVGAQQET